MFARLASDRSTFAAVWPSPDGLCHHCNPRFSNLAMTFALFVVTVVALAIIAVMSTYVLRARRETYVRTYMFPTGLIDALAKRRPGLSLKERQLVAHALRQFFLVYLKVKRRHVAMPSQVVDDLWHEFILYTQNYKAFCRHAFGRFLHHTPAVVLGPDRQSNVGLRRVWWQACLEENINPRRPTRLPLLFALDKKLGITEGFVYAIDCDAVRRKSAEGNSTVVYCGADFGSSSVDGSTSGFGGDWSGMGGESGGGGASSSFDAIGSASDGGSGGSDGGSSGCGGGCSSS
jgi:hypothetical protein